MTHQPDDKISWGTPELYSSAASALKLAQEGALLLQETLDVCTALVKGCLFYLRMVLIGQIVVMAGVVCMYTTGVRQVYGPTIVLGMLFTVVMALLGARRLLKTVSKAVTQKPPAGAGG